MVLYLTSNGIQLGILTLFKRLYFKCEFKNIIHPNKIFILHDIHNSYEIYPRTAEQLVWPDIHVLC